MSRPEIALHKSNVMTKKTQIRYQKRTQKDYSMSFKLQIVQDIESGFESVSSVRIKYGIQSRSTIVNWLRKFGNFDWQHQTPNSMSKTTEQKLMELEQKVKLLEKQKSQLEKQIEQSDKKSIIFDMMIDLAEKEYNIPIRKNYSPEQSTAIKNKKKKA
jgi:transposase